MINMSKLNFTGHHRLPVILQTEVAECGIASLAMVASYHHYKIDIGTLRRKYSISSQGMSLKDIIDIANDLKFDSRPLQLELDELEQLQTPCILHWDLNHFVVLKSANKSHIVIHDPARGQCKLSYKECSKHFTGIALELSPAQNFETKNEQISIKLSDFWGNLKGIMPILGRVFLLSLFLQLIAIASPFYMQTVVDNVIVGNDRSFLAALALGFLILLGIQLLISTLRSFILMYMSSQLNLRMMSSLFKHLLHLPMDYFEKRHIGDISSRFGSLNNIKEFLTTGIVAVILDGLMASITLIMMIIYSPMLASIVVGMVLLYALIRLLFYPHFRSLNEENLVVAAKENTNFLESIRAMQCIKLFGIELSRVNLWKNRAVDTINTGIKLNRTNIWYNLINTALMGIENVLIIYLAAHMVLDNQFTIGMMYAFIAYKGQFEGKTSALITAFIDYKMLSLHLERLSDITREEPEPGLQQPDKKALVDGSIEVKELSFRYASNQAPIFENINIAIEQGECVAIVGPSGCGKTTLMKIMLGLLKPERGQLLVDGKDLNQVGLKNYRTQIASVMQDDQLLSGSIAENICLFDEKPDQERIEHCAQLAAIHTDIMNMSMHYETLVGDMGNTLSGGQKQRILLARALYKQPRILFMDEATSHLDKNTERAVNEATKALNVTRVIIAHRHETINLADRVIQLQDGHISDIQKLDWKTSH